GSAGKVRFHAEFQQKDKCEHFPAERCRVCRQASYVSALPRGRRCSNTPLPYWSRTTLVDSRVRGGCREALQSDRSWDRAGQRRRTERQWKESNNTQRASTTANSSRTGRPPRYAP